MRICSLAARNRARRSASRRHQPADPDPGQPVRLRQRRDADRALGQRRRERQRLAERHLAVRLVDQQAAVRWASTSSTISRSASSDMTWPVGLCGVVSDTSLVRGREQRRDPLRVDGPAVLVAQVEVADVRADGPRRLEVRGVVRPNDDEVVAGPEQRRVDDEQRRRRARGHEDVVGPERRRAGRDRRPQRRAGRGGRRTCRTRSSSSTPRSRSGVSATELSARLERIRS